MTNKSETTELNKALELRHAEELRTYATRIEDFTAWREMRRAQGLALFSPQACARLARLMCDAAEAQQVGDDDEEFNCIYMARELLREMLGACRKSPALLADADWATAHGIGLREAARSRARQGAL